jgi:hypothetical protein
MMYVILDLTTTMTPELWCWIAYHRRSPSSSKIAHLNDFTFDTGAATSELTASQTQDFIKQRFSH